MRLRTAAALGTAAVGVTAIGFALRRVLRDVPVEPDADLALPDDAIEVVLRSYDGGTIRVVERGAGRPLVLLHGIALGAPIWSYQLRDLAGAARVVVPEWRGHGGSAAGTDGYGLDRLARDLATVLGELDLRGAVVAGHSMGGMALMRFLADHADVADERVAGVVFLSTGASARVPDVLAGMAARAGAAILCDGHLRVPLPSTAGGLVRRAPLIAFQRGFGRDPVPAHVAHTREVIAATTTLASMSSGFAMLAHDGITALRALALPALVLVGSRDRVTPPREARRIADLLSNGRLVVLDGAGHQLMLERRHEVDEHLRSFLHEVAA